MPFASLSILGLYQYNDDVFDNLQLPDGINREILIKEICTECSDFPLIYSDYDFMKMLIGVWSVKEQRIWSELYESEQFEYNPIENYDRHESITREVESESSGSSSGTTTGTGSGSNTNTASQTAFNSDSFKDTGRSTGSQNSSTSSTDSSTASQAASGTETTTTYIHGNIGVTTAQQMIQGYRDIVQFSTYNYIVDSFKNRFCLQVY